jgi:hypothetical protein
MTTRGVPGTIGRRARWFVRATAVFVGLVVCLSFG